MAVARFYVDGFNLYHSLKTHSQTAKAFWLDLWSLCGAIKAPAEALGGVVYFTALTPWNQGKMLRHQTFLSALKSTGVEVVEGRFSLTSRECAICGKIYESHEEKETDVNIATRILADAFSGAVDTMYLLTGDSDQVPTIRAVRQLAPERTVVGVFSVNRHSAELKKVAHRTVQLSWKHFRRNQLPDPVVIRPGVVLSCPPSWKER